MTQTKDQSYQFSNEIQTQIVAFLLQDKENFPSNFELIKPEFFNSCLSDLVGLIVKFFKKYKRVPNDAELLEEVEVSALEMRRRSVAEAYIDTVEKVLEIKTHGNFEYVRDKVEEFARFQAHRNAIIDSVDLLQKKRDFDGIKKLFERAAQVGTGGRELETVTLSDVEPKEVEWLWPDRIPLGKLTLFVGDPGVGKGFFSMMVAAHVSTGRPWPTNPLYEFEPGTVLLLDAEDCAADTLIPRLMWNHADLSRIIAIRGAKEGKWFSLTKDLAALEREVVRTSAKLIIISPVNSYIGKVDSHKDSDVRTVLTPLAQLAEKYGVAVIGITHMNKSEAMAVIYRAQGSIAYVGLARSVWLIKAEKRENLIVRYFVPLKANLAINPLGFQWTIDDGAVIMGPEDPKLSAEHLLAPRSADKLEEAKSFLAKSLASGSTQAEQIQKMARGFGITESTLNRAKRDLGVKSLRIEGDPYRWQWALGDSTDGDENSVDGGSDSVNGSLPEGRED